MNNGLSDRSVELRRHLLSYNGPDVVRRMAASSFSDPVGLIIEMTDDTGKQLTYAALELQGMLQQDIAELIASYCRKAIPTLKIVVDFETAKSVLSLTSDTAEQNLSVPRRVGFYWIVIVAGGGNSYALVPVRTGYPLLALRGEIPRTIPIVPVYMHVERTHSEYRFHVAECELVVPAETLPVLCDLRVVSNRTLILPSFSQRS